MPASWTLSYQIGDVQHTLKVMEAALDDPSELMEDVLLVMIRSTQLNFDANGRPNKWAELAWATKVHRAHIGLPKGTRLTREQVEAAAASMQLLRNTGLLWQSVGGVASGPFNTADGFGESFTNEAIIGTNRPGWQNQFDDTRGRRKAREFVLFQDVDVEDILDMSMQWVMQTGPYAA